jgi:hypothetical protein
VPLTIFTNRGPVLADTGYEGSARASASLQCITVSPTKIGDIAKSSLVLTGADLGRVGAEYLAGDRRSKLQRYLISCQEWPLKTTRRRSLGAAVVLAGRAAPHRASSRAKPGGRRHPQARLIRQW